MSRYGGVLGFGAGGQTGGVDLLLASSENNVNLFTRLGSPVNIRLWTIVIADDVVISSTSTGTAAMRTTASFPGGTTFRVIFQGQATIVGKGGAGGAGGGFATVPGKVPFPGSFGGGGGGGANAGAGGASGGGGAIPGAAGGLELGGAGGSSQFNDAATDVAAGAGLVGGVALETHFPMTLNTDLGDGSIWGGGGGGGGVRAGDVSGGAGGNAGSAGTAGPSGGGAGGAAGAAISLQGAGSIVYQPNKPAFDLRGSAP